jgi:very-short-patch-repair endonuclease
MTWPNRTNTDLARNLRNNATDAERIRWRVLIASNIDGVVAEIERALKALPHAEGEKMGAALP